MASPSPSDARALARSHYAIELSRTGCYIFTALMAHSSAWKSRRTKQMPKKYRSKVMAAVHETASDLHGVGGMDKRTMRQFDALCLTPIQEMTPKKIRALREREKASQTVFAAYLNV